MSVYTHTPPASSLRISLEFFSQLWNQIQPGLKADEDSTRISPGEWVGGCCEHHSFNKTQEAQQLETLVLTKQEGDIQAGAPLI